MDDERGAMTQEGAGAIDPVSVDARSVPDPSVSGPLDRPTAVALLGRADEFLDAGDFAAAGQHYNRVIGYPEASITAAALLGLGTALYRLDHDAEALSAWEQVLQLPETPGTYLAWRHVAAARVREGDLPGAMKAYREAEKRAPADDRAEIASRLGWLAKETGDVRSSRRYFARSRGATMPTLTFAIMAVTIIVSVTAWSALGTSLDLYRPLWLDKGAVANGEYWRLISDTLLHAQPPFGYMHLFFNMYALYLAGSLVEQLYGWRLYGLMYVLTGVAASVASFVFGGDIPSVGASGAVFGLFGVLLAVSRTHQPMLDRRGQRFLGQIGTLVLVNLLFGFSLGGSIDNSAHVGGLVSGLWLGFLLVPGRVPTLASIWQHPATAAGGDGQVAPAVLRLLGVLALVVAIVIGLLVGTDARRPPGPANSSLSIVAREFHG